MSCHPRVRNLVMLPIIPIDLPSCRHYVQRQVLKTMAAETESTAADAGTAS